MKKVFAAFLFCMLFAPAVSYAVPPNYSWHGDNEADLGRDVRRWNDIYLGGKIIQGGGSGTMYYTGNIAATLGTVTTTYSGDDQHGLSYNLTTGTTATNIKHAVVFSPGIPGKMYVVKNGTNGTITVNTSTGTGTTISNGKSAIVVIDTYPDVKEVVEFSN